MGQGPQQGYGRGGGIGQGSQQGYGRGFGMGDNSQFKGNTGQMGGGKEQIYDYALVICNHAP